MKDLSNLPRGEASERPVSISASPDEDPTYAKPLVEAWWQWYQGERDQNLAHAVSGTRFRASMAGMCSRRLAYYMAGDEESDPTTVADAWRFGIGHYAHEAFQAAYQRAFPQAEVELNVDFRGAPLELDGSAHADLVVQHEDSKDLIELKTTGGFAYKLMATNFRRTPPQGPKWGAVIQGALSATQLGCDKLVIVYLSLENLSPGVAADVGDGTEIGRFAAQWTFTPDEFEPIAYDEAARITAILETVDDLGPQAVPRNLVDPDLPRGARIVDPGTSRWEVVQDGIVLDSGRAWYGNYCDYCPYQTRCALD